MGISIRAYAQHRGVSDTAVHKALKTGRIMAEPDGSIHVERADREWRLNTSQKKEAALSQAKEGARESSQKPWGEGVSGGVTYTQAKTANEAIKAQLNRLNLQEKKGELMNKDMVEAQVFRLARQFRDTVQNWPSRVSAQMAAELQVNEHLLQITLEAYLRELLNELAETKLNLE